MTQLQTLVERLRRRPPEATFEDVRTVLEAFGWHLSRQSGSHVSYVKKGYGRITFPLISGRRVKQHYVDTICERLGLDDWHGDE